MDLVLLTSAENDIQEAFNRYESFREGLGEVFLHHVEQALEKIRLFPKSAPMYTGNYRRQLVKRFPYGIFFVSYTTRIVVSGVKLLTQDPNRIAEGLR